MGTSVKIIEDSINPYNKIRLTTFQLRYPRFIHSEVMTHRVFSRNASSSRAIPISTFIKQVWNDPAAPIHWGKNQSGMQASIELDRFKKWFTKKIWNFSGKLMCCLVWISNIIAAPHKQTMNRLLEPWQYISVVLTATEFDNWFELRNHHDAQPEIKDLAQMMKFKMLGSIPMISNYHLPYITDIERIQYSVIMCMQMSAARCARVSYLTHDGKTPNVSNDIKLYSRLVGSKPLHASPTEHQAFAKESKAYNKNFKGWEQFRVSVENNINNTYTGKEKRKI